MPGNEHCGFVTGQECYNGLSRMTSLLASTLYNYRRIAILTAHDQECPVQAGFLLYYSAYIPEGHVAHWMRDCMLYYLRTLS